MTSIHVPPTRILAAADFGEASATGIWIAGSLAAHFGARLTVLHAESLDAPPYFTPQQIELLERERQAARAGAVTYAREFVARHTTTAADVVVVDGPPTDAILAHVGEADLTVLGTHGYRGPRRWWLGSVAERVVRDAARPVLVAHAVVNRSGNWRPAEVASLGVASGGAAAAWAQALATLAGVTPAQYADAATCRPEALARATVVVPLVRSAQDRPVLPALGRLLTGCTAPVLFVPEPGHLDQL